jgi:hypothetical protein
LKSFCRLLRTGVDPVLIVVSRQMPRYELDESQCGNLWHYLTEGLRDVPSQDQT